MWSIPALVMALDDDLPCRQLVALDIGCSDFDATTMLYRIGADDFDLAHANAGATGDVQPDIARRLYWIACSIVSSRTCTAPNRRASARATVVLPVPGSPPNTMSIATLTPDFACDLHAPPELGALLVLAQQVAQLRIGEAALRRQAELVDRCELGRLVDAALELVLALQLAGLRRHDAQHDLLALREKAQRLEAAGAVGVVF